MIERICPKCKIVMNSEHCVNPKCNHATQLSSTIYWCKKCLVPVFEKKCPECGAECEYLATDVRPVFPEENMLFSIIHTGDPFTYQRKSVWYASGAYIVDGKKVKISVSQLNKKSSEELHETRNLYYESCDKLK